MHIIIMETKEQIQREMLLKLKKKLGNFYSLIPMKKLTLKSSGTVH